MVPPGLKGTSPTRQGHHYEGWVGSTWLTNQPRTTKNPSWGGIVTYHITFSSYHRFDMNFLLSIPSFHKKRKSLLISLNFQNWVDHKILVNGNCMKYCQTVMRHNFVARNFCFYYFWVLKSTYFGEWLNKLLILFLKVTLHCFIWSFQWIYSFQFPMNQTSIQDSQ